MKSTTDLKAGDAVVSAHGRTGTVLRVTENPLNSNGGIAMVTVAWEWGGRSASIARHTASTLTRKETP